MNVKKLCWRKNNTNNEQERGGIHLSRIQCLPLSSLSGSALGNVSQCPSLALGSQFETTSDPQSLAVFFRLGGSPLFCPASLLSAQGPGLVHLMTREQCQYYLHLPPDLVSGAIRKVGFWVAAQGCCSVFREDGGSVYPPPHHTSWSVSDYFQ